MRFTLLAAFLLLASCGQRQAGYPAEARLNFRNACIEQGAAAGVCDCIWQRIEAEIPAEDFMALERLPIPELVDHPLTAQMDTYRLACAPPPEVAPSSEPPPAP